jgi:hypothetical protein
VGNRGLSGHAHHLVRRQFRVRIVSFKRLPKEVGKRIIKQEALIYVSGEVQFDGEVEGCLPEDA